MKVAVCCPGNSLPKRWPGDYEYVGVWAVNRALLHIPNADWLSAGDIVVFQGLLGNERPRMGVITTDDSAAISRGYPEWNHLTITGWRECSVIAEHCISRQINFSVQAALCHASSLGATDIDLFGCDGINSTKREDCTGYIGEDRSLARWTREENDLAYTFQFLKERGTTINRIPP